MQLIVYAELFLFIVSFGLLTYEISVLKGIITHRTTLSLLSFLSLLTFVNLIRVLGINSNNLMIRTYATSIIALLAALSLLYWGMQIMYLSQKYKILYFGSLSVGMLMYLASRITASHILEIAGISIMISAMGLFMIQILSYVFRKSPYIRARQRLFIITISFIFLMILEGFAVNNMNEGNFKLSTIFFLLEIPWRIGLTISIVLPVPVTDFLRKFIH